MSQGDPINPMVLSYVAKLKDIGAELARKSASSPHPYVDTYDVDTLASVARAASGIPIGGSESSSAPSVTFNAGPSELASLLMAGKLWGEEPRQQALKLPNPSAYQIGHEILSAVSQHEGEEEEEEGDEGNLNAGDGNNKESATADEDEQPADGEAEEEEEDEEDEAPLPPCDPECLNILIDPSAPLVENGIGVQEGVSASGPVVTQPESETEIASTTKHQVMSTASNSDHIAISNSINPFIQVQPEFVERQTSAAESRLAPEFKPILLLLHLFALSWAQFVCLRMRRQLESL